MSHGDLSLARYGLGDEDVTMDDSVTWNYDNPVYDQQRGRWYFEGRRPGALMTLLSRLFPVSNAS